MLALSINNRLLFFSPIRSCWLLHAVSTLSSTRPFYYQLSIQSPASTFVSSLHHLHLLNQGLFHRPYQVEVVLALEVLTNFSPCAMPHMATAWHGNGSKTSGQLLQPSITNLLRYDNFIISYPTSAIHFLVYRPPTLFYLTSYLPPYLPSLQTSTLIAIADMVPTTLWDLKRFISDSDEVCDDPPQHLSQSSHSRDKRTSQSSNARKSSENKVGLGNVLGPVREVTDIKGPKHTLTSVLLPFLPALLAVMRTLAHTILFRYSLDSSPASSAKPSSLHSTSSSSKTNALWFSQPQSLSTPVDSHAVEGKGVDSDDSLLLRNAVGSVGPSEYLWQLIAPLVTHDARDRIAISTQLNLAGLPPLHDQQHSSISVTNEVSQSTHRMEQDANQDFKHQETYPPVSGSNQNSINLSTWHCGAGLASHMWQYLLSHKGHIALSAARSSLAACPAIRAYKYVARGISRILGTLCDVMYVKHATRIGNQTGKATADLARDDQKHVGAEHEVNSNESIIGVLRDTIGSVWTVSVRKIATYSDPRLLGMVGDALRRHLSLNRVLVSLPLSLQLLARLYTDVQVISGDLVQALHHHHSLSHSSASHNPSPSDASKLCDTAALIISHRLRFRFASTLALSVVSRSDWLSTLALTTIAGSTSHELNGAAAPSGAPLPPPLPMLSQPTLLAPLASEHPSSISGNPGPSDWAIESTYATLLPISVALFVAGATQLEPVRRNWRIYQAYSPYTGHHTLQQTETTEKKEISFFSFIIPGLASPSSNPKVPGESPPTPITRGGMIELQRRIGDTTLSMLRSCIDPRLGSCGPEEQGERALNSPIQASCNPTNRGGSRLSETSSDLPIDPHGQLFLLMLQRVDWTRVLASQSAVSFNPLLVSLSLPLRQPWFSSDPLGLPLTSPTQQLETKANDIASAAFPPTGLISPPQVDLTLPTIAYLLPSPSFAPNQGIRHAAPHLAHSPNTSNPALSETHSELTWSPALVAKPPTAFGQFMAPLSALCLLAAKAQGLVSGTIQQSHPPTSPPSSCSSSSNFANTPLLPLPLYSSQTEHTSPISLCNADLARLSISLLHPYAPVSQLPLLLHNTTPVDTVPAPLGSPLPFLPPLPHLDMSQLCHCAANTSGAVAINALISAIAAPPALPEPIEFITPSMSRASPSVSSVMIIPPTEAQYLPSPPFVLRGAGDRGPTRDGLRNAIALDRTRQCIDFLLEQLHVGMFHQYGKS